MAFAGTYKPMRVQFELEREEFDRAKAAMREISRRTSLRPVMIKIGAYLRYETQRNFDTGGRHAGKPWAANQNRYKRWKYRYATDARVLHRFLKLRRAVAMKYGADHVEKATNRGLTFGIDPASEMSRIAGAHRAGRFGGGFHRGGVRSSARYVRDPLRFKSGTNAEIKEMIRRYILTGDLPDVVDA